MKDVLPAPDVGTSAALLAAAAHPERIAGVIVSTGGASGKASEQRAGRALIPGVDHLSLRAGDLELRTN